ncbi:AroM family protein [Maledivibacter halophilus]|uniref:AroM family protein n=1 Tax=Maledivibacter halophilus TaxID=36842 RepID=UPI0014836C5E|nr:AroM family protein [Maledivibacter halophilus]
MKKIGVITIGQSPRNDLIPEIEKYINNDVQIVEYGILDDYTYEEAIRKFEPVKGKNVLVSRMREGTQIEMNEDIVCEELQKNIYKVEKDGISTILLLCTGKFPQFNHKALLITPFSIIHSIVKSISGKEKVGIIIPDSSQIRQCNSWWKDSDINVVIETASPYNYSKAGMKKAAMELKKQSVSMIVMDCMGYTIEMKKTVQDITKGPVILSRILVTRVLNEIL